MEGKFYYTIGEVAEMMETSTSQLRYWSGEFNLNVRKNRKGDRLFQKEDLDKLRLIQRMLKDEGYTIEGAKKKLKQSSKEKLTIPIADNDVENELIIETSKEKKESIQNVANRLRMLKMNLESLKFDIEYRI